MTDRPPMTPQDIRLHAVSLAVATYREVFLVARKDEEKPDVAEQVLADARRYATWIERGDEATVATPDAEACGYARAVAALRDDERYSNWWTSTGVQPVGTVRQHLADYLEAINQPLPTTDERTPTR